MPPLHWSRPADTLPESPASGLCSLGWEANLGLSIKFVILSEVSGRRTQSKDLRFVRGRAEGASMPTQSQPDARPQPDRTNQPGGRSSGAHSSCPNAARSLRRSRPIRASISFATAASVRFFSESLHHLAPPARLISTPTAQRRTGGKILDRVLVYRP